MAVCEDIVCEAKVADCTNLTPEICGSGLLPTMTECVADNIVPQIDCIESEIYLGACD